jgi:hypothetical protein
MVGVPSRGWYFVAAALVLVPVGAAGFDLGSQARQTLAAIDVVPEGGELVVALDAGEARTIFSRVGPQTTSQGRSAADDCEVAAADDQQPPLIEPVQADVEVSFFDEGWVASKRFEALAPGRLTVSCSAGDWAVGPDVGRNGLAVVTMFAGWTGRFAIWVLPGLLLGAVTAVVVAHRRRTTN